METALYLDTSAVLHATIEGSVKIGERISMADTLVTSRLSLVESSRAFVRLRLHESAEETKISAAERAAEEVYCRCEIWEITTSVCEQACRISPRAPLRAVDALHAATFLLARKRIDGLALLSVDERLLRALGLTS